MADEQGPQFGQITMTEQEDCSEENRITTVFTDWKWDAQYEVSLPHARIRAYLTSAQEVRDQAKMFDHLLGVWREMLQGGNLVGTVYHQAGGSDDGEATELLRTPRIRRGISWSLLAIHALRDSLRLPGEAVRLAVLVLTRKVALGALLQYLYTRLRFTLWDEMQQLWWTITHMLATPPNIEICKRCREHMVWCDTNLPECVRCMMMVTKYFGVSPWLLDAPEARRVHAYIHLQQWRADLREAIDEIISGLRNESPQVKHILRACTGDPVVSFDTGTGMPGDRLL
jgi:hypothetical protein